MNKLHHEMASYGLSLGFAPEVGKMTRVNDDGTLNRTGKADWWLKVFPEGKAVFGNFKTGLRRTVTIQNNPIPRAEIERAVAESKSIREAKQDRAYRVSYGLWSNAKTGSHTYLTAKGLSPTWTRITKDGGLLIPFFRLRSNRVLIEIRNPKPEGGFQAYCPAGGDRTGHFGVIGTRRQNRAVIAEGFATAASLHEHFGHDCVVYVGGSANLLPVAKELRDASAGVEIIIAADDDWMRETNVGLLKAQEAAGAVGGSVIVPDWPSDRPEWATDFSDLYLLQRA